VSNETCIFCKIIDGKIPTEILFQNDICIIINDIKPDAPIHWLAIPKEHVETPQDTSIEVIGTLAKEVSRLALNRGFSQKGYRLIINCGPDGGQEIGHLHLHLLAGEHIGPLRTKSEVI